MKKIIGILVVTLLIGTSSITVIANNNDDSVKLLIEKKYGQPIELTVGECDMFEPPNEPTDPSPALIDWISNNYAYSNTKDCDEDTEDRYWAHSFNITYICHPTQIESATLQITVRNDDENDHLKIGCISCGNSWRHNNRLEVDGIPVGSGGSIILDLEDIPGLLDDMNQCGMLDIAVDDDSPVDCAKLIIYCESIPDLDIPGNLSWTDMKPGETATAILQISNIGEIGSNLNWKIIEYPEWGTWTFTPENGQNQKPEEGPVEVEVEVEAPEEEDKEFSGEVKIVNIDNTADYEIISVSLSTPKIKSVNEFNPCLSRLIQRFLILEFLL
jgi:hypothetical protein